MIKFPSINQIGTKKLGSAVANKARAWFIENLNSNFGE